MSDPAPTTALDKLDVMLDKARRHGEEACRVIDAEAQGEARAIIARAHQDARARVHAAIVLERQNGKSGLEKVRARIETDKRQNLQAKEHAFLAEAWLRLDAAIKARWQNATHRATWIAATVMRATETLQPGTWAVQHPVGWNTAELGPHLDTVAAHGGAKPQFEASEDLDVGLRISVGGAVLDAGAEGILADRDHISALLLAELFALIEQDKAATEVTS